MGLLRKKGSELPRARKKRSWTALAPGEKNEHNNGGGEKISLPEEGHDPKMIGRRRVKKRGKRRPPRNKRKEGENRAAHFSRRECRDLREGGKISGPFGLWHREGRKKGEESSASKRGQGRKSLFRCEKEGKPKKKKKNLNGGKNLGSLSGVGREYEKKDSAVCGKRPFLASYHR